MTDRRTFLATTTAAGLASMQGIQAESLTNSIVELKAELLPTFKVLLEEPSKVVASVDVFDFIRFQEEGQSISDSKVRASGTILNYVEAGKEITLKLV